MIDFEQSQLRGFDVLSDPENKDHAIHAFTLPEGMSFFLVEKCRTLYVRASTRRLFDVIEQHRADGVQGAVVNGNPGIGKSWTLLYFMLRYLAQGNTVVFESKGKALRWVLTPNVSERSVTMTSCGLDVHLPVLDKPETIFLVDPADTAHGSPLHCDAFTLINSSPDARHFQQFLKRVSMRFIADVWKASELLLVGAHQGTAGESVRSADQIKRRFDIVGGVPRLVLGSPFSEAELRVYIDMKVSRVKDNMSLLLQAGPDGGLYSDASFSVVELAAGPDFKYQNEEINLMSPYVTKKMVDVAVNMEASLIKQFSRQRGEISGPFFEEHVKRQMKGSVVLVMRPLLVNSTESDEQDITVHCAVPMFHAATNEFPWEADCAVWPKAKNFPAIDMAIPAKKQLFQVTVNHDHEINLPGMESHLKSMDAISAGKAQFIVLTRDTDFPSMTAMSWTKNRKSDDKIAALNNRFEQWVAYIKYD